MLKLSSHSKCLLCTVASLTKEINLRLAKRPLKINERLANRRLISLIKEAIGVRLFSTNLLIFQWFIANERWSYTMDHCTDPTIKEISSISVLYPLKRNCYFVTNWEFVMHQVVVIPSDWMSRSRCWLPARPGPRPRYGGRWAAWGGAWCRLAGWTWRWETRGRHWSRLRRKTGCTLQGRGDKIWW